LSEPDHLWAIALLEDERGAPVWLPIDASTTREGRPLRVPHRPPGKFKPPRDPSARAPSTPRWAQDDLIERAPKKKKRSPPRAELLKLVHYLAQIGGVSVDSEERKELEAALDDPEKAKTLLERWLDR
jgi:hypothetical protein